MKRIGIFAIAAMILNVNVWAEDLSVSLKSSTGFFWAGMTSEFVYEKNYQLSKLDWEEPFAPYLDFGSFVSYKKFFLDANIKNVFPVPLGTMRDYDWFNHQETTKTHYSEHDISLENHFEYRGQIGYTFTIGQIGLDIAPAVGFGGLIRKRTAKDGYYQYADWEDGDVWTESLDKKNFYGPVISYQEMIWFPFITLDLTYTITRFRIGLRGRFYPYIYAETIDVHHITGERFLDTMNKGPANGMGIGGELAASCIYTLSESTAFFVEIGGEWITAQKGIGASGFLGKEVTNDAGAGSQTKSRIGTFSIGIILFPLKFSK